MIERPTNDHPSFASLPSPEPAAGLEAYESERESALSFSAKRRENYERYQNSARRSARLDYLPIKLDVENVSRCNYRCTMCVVSDWNKGKRAEDMPFGEFKRLIDEQYGLVEIKLQGIGEPSMQGDVFFDMIQYARSQHIWVRTTTNASFLHLKDNFKKYIDSDANEIQISIDGADKETFEGIRRGGRFERVTDNCQKINAHSRERGVVRTKMWTVVQRANQHQLEDLVDLAHQLGFTNQVFSLDMTGWGTDDWAERNAAESVGDSMELDRLLALVDRGAALGVKVSFWVINEKYSTRATEKLCPWPFERAVVTSDLRTVPCCTIGDPDAYELGKGVRFTDLWQSDEYVSFRQAHLDGAIPKVCQTCYYKAEHFPS